MLELDAVEQLHHDVRRAAVQARDVGDPAHVLGAQADHRARLAHEPLADVGVAQHLLAQELDRRARAQLEVGGGDHDAHPADPDDVVDPEPAADHGADRQPGDAVAGLGAVPGHQRGDHLVAAPTGRGVVGDDRPLVRREIAGHQLVEDVDLGAAHGSAYDGTRLPGVQSVVGGGRARAYGHRRRTARIRSAASTPGSLVWSPIASVPLVA